MGISDIYCKCSTMEKRRTFVLRVVKVGLIAMLTLARVSAADELSTPSPQSTSSAPNNAADKSSGDLPDMVDDFLPLPGTQSEQSVDQSDLGLDPWTDHSFDEFDNYYYNKEDDAADRTTTTSTTTTVVPQNVQNVQTSRSEKNASTTPQTAMSTSLASGPAASVAGSDVTGNAAQTTTARLEPNNNNNTKRNTSSDTLPQTYAETTTRQPNRWNDSAVTDDVTKAEVLATSPFMSTTSAASTSAAATVAEVTSRFSTPASLSSTSPAPHAADITLPEDPDPNLTSHVTTRTPTSASNTTTRSLNTTKAVTKDKQSTTKTASAGATTDLPFLPRIETFPQEKANPVTPERPGGDYFADWEMWPTSETWGRETSDDVILSRDWNNALSLDDESREITDTMAILLMVIVITGLVGITIVSGVYCVRAFCPGGLSRYGHGYRTVTDTDPLLGF